MGVLAERMSSKLHCVPCCRKDVSSPADKYCTECKEHVCADCVTAHNSFKAFSSHCLVNISSTSSSTLPIPKFCLEHNMALDFFCADHDCLCCRLCMSESHRVCQKFLPLDIAAKGVSRSAMFEDVRTTLSNIRKTLAEMIETRQNNTKVLAHDKNKVLVEIAVVKAEILQRLNEVEEEVKLRIESERQKFHSKIEAQKTTISQLSNSVDEITRHLDFASKHGSESQAFILMNTCKLGILRLETKIHEFIPKLETTRISFSRVDIDIRSLKAFGSIKVASSPCNIKYLGTKMNQAQVPPPEPRVLSKFTFDRQFDIKSGHVCITSIAVTDDNRLLLGNNNCAELLVYSNDGNHQLNCTLTDVPWDIAIIPGEDKAVVSLNESNKIQFINTKSMKAGSTHSVPGEYCYGITVVNGKICVGSKMRIYILNKKGKYEKTISVPDVGIIYYLHPGPRDSVYYTACDNHTAGCVKLSGEILFTYTNDNFIGPEAVVTDNGGNIYIACYGSNNIHRLTSEGKCTDIILTRDGGIDKLYGLAFSKDYRDLFVSNKKGKNISIFSCK